MKWWWDEFFCIVECHVMNLFYYGAGIKYQRINPLVNESWGEGFRIMEYAGEN